MLVAWSATRSRKRETSKSRIARGMVLGSSHHEREQLAEDLLLEGVRLAHLACCAIGIGGGIGSMGSDPWGGRVRTRRHVRVRLLCQVHAHARLGRPRGAGPTPGTPLMMATLQSWRETFGDGGRETDTGEGRPEDENRAISGPRK